MGREKEDKERLWKKKERNEGGKLKKNKRGKEEGLGKGKIGEREWKFEGKGVKIYGENSISENGKR